MAKFVVVEGNHLDPNDIKSLLPETKVIHGPFIKEEDADKLAKKLIQKILITTTTGPGSFRIKIY